MSDHTRLRDLPLNFSFFCVGALLYTPILVLYLSHNPGAFTFASLAWPAAYCLLSVVIPCLLWWRWRGLAVFDTLMLGPALYVLIAATFFPVSGSVLDGTERVVGKLDRELHVGLMAACLVVALLSISQPALKKQSQRVVNLLALFAVFASVGMALAIFPVRDTKHDNRRYTAALSPKQNVIVVVMDMLQGSFASEYFKRNPAAEQAFDGFVFYRNAASFAPFTALSYAGFMSGGYPGKDQLRGGMVHDTIYYKNNIIDDMARLGYATRYFSIITYENDNKDVVRIPDDIGLRRKDSFFLFALTVRGRYLPYGYLPFGIKFMPWTQLEFGWLSKTDARDSFKWYLENVAVDRNIDKGFLWFHSLITHQPIRFDAAGRFSIDLKPDDANGEVAYALGLVQTFLARLEKLGAYDNSLVIVIADHGYNILKRMRELPEGAEYSRSPFGSGISVGQYNPLIMVKLPGARGRLTYDETAVTLLDLRKSLREFAAPGSGSTMDGFNFLGAEKGSRNRTVPAIRFVGRRFDPRDFVDLENWRPDTLRLPFDVNYAQTITGNTGDAGGEIAAIDRK